MGSRIGPEDYALCTNGTAGPGAVWTVILQCGATHHLTPPHLHLCRERQRQKQGDNNIQTIHRTMMIKMMMVMKMMMIMVKTGELNNFTGFPCLIGSSAEK